MDFFEEMPSLGRRDLMTLRKGIDAGFRSFSRSYGEDLENFFDPLLQFLIFFEKLLIAAPWPIILLIVAGLTWLGSRSWRIVVGSVICFVLIGYLGMWEDTMSTVAMISVATLNHNHVEHQGFPHRAKELPWACYVLNNRSIRD